MEYSLLLTGFWFILCTIYRKAFKINQAFQSFYFMAKIKSLAFDKRSSFLPQMYFVLFIKVIRRNTIWDSVIYFWSNLTVILYYHRLESQRSYFNSFLASEL